MCGMILSYAWGDLFMCLSRLIHVCDTTHLILWPTQRVWHDPFNSMAQLIHVVCVTWLTLTCIVWFIHMCAVTHSYVPQDLFGFVTWLIQMMKANTSYFHNMIRSFVWRDSSTRVAWLTHVRDVTMRTHFFLRNSDLHGATYSCVWHDSFI